MRLHKLSCIFLEACVCGLLLQEYADYSRHILEGMRLHKLSCIFLEACVCRLLLQEYADGNSEAYNAYSWRHASADCSSNNMQIATHKPIMHILGGMRLPTAPPRTSPLLIYDYFFFFL